MPISDFDIFMLTKEMPPAEEDLVRISTGTASKGNQEKYKSRDNKWYFKTNLYYQDEYWRDDLVEVIASRLAGQGFICGDTEVLNQYSSHRFERIGTLSQNFAKQDEEYISFNRLARNNNIEVQLNKGLDTFLAVCDVYERVCDIDATDFLLTQSVLDFLVGNEDRHTDNFGVMYNGTTYRLHPCFDFGIGMFEHEQEYEKYSFKEKLNNMYFRMFGMSQYILIQQLQRRYPDFFSAISKITVQPSKFEFPSIDAEKYLRNACIKLEVSLCND